MILNCWENQTSYKGSSWFKFHDRKLKYDLLVSQNPICSCGLKQPIKTTYHLFNCTNFINELAFSLNVVLRITKDKLPSGDTTFVRHLLSGDKFYLVANTQILNASIDFILLSKRFFHVIFFISIFLFLGTPIFKV